MKYILIGLSFFLSIPLCLADKIVCLIPFPGGSPQDFRDPHSSRDEIAKPFCRLRERLGETGYNVIFAIDPQKIDDIVAVISFNNLNIPFLDRIPLEKRWLSIWEPPVVQAFMYHPSLTSSFGKIFVMFDDLVDNVHYFKFCYPQPRQCMLSDIPPFHKKKFCVMISGNKYSSHPYSLYQERLKTIAFFENHHPCDFDLYGTGWLQRKSYKGTVPAKWDVIKQYKFCICYENMQNQKGYITEKIFDVMVAGCVPIYWGASNITNYIPADCFIDRRDFNSHEELYCFLKSITPELYENYLNAIRRYFRSDRARLYSIETFVDTILNRLAPVITPNEHIAVDLPDHPR